MQGNGGANFINGNIIVGTSGDDLDCPAGSRKWIGVAVVGTGRMGSVHSLTLAGRDDVRLLWLIDMNVENAHRLRSELGLSQQTMVGPEVAEALEDNNVAVVVVCTPSFAHEETVMSALNAGKHVFCEKPLAMSAEGVCWLVGGARRVVRVSASACVSAQTSRAEFEEAGDFDTACVTLTFDDGSIGSIDVARNSPAGYDQRVEVVLQDAAVHVDNVRSSAVVTIDGGGRSSLDGPKVGEERYVEAYRLEVEHFLAAVGCRRRELRVTPEQLRQVARVVDACKLAVSTNATVAL